MRGIYSEAFRINDYKKEIGKGHFDHPASKNWLDLKDDARACSSDSKEIPLRIAWVAKEQQYWLEGTRQSLNQFDSLSLRAARRLGYHGPHYVVCLLECLRSRDYFEEEREYGDPDPNNERVFEDGMRVQFVPVKRTGEFVIESAFSVAAELFMEFSSLDETTGVSRSTFSEQTVSGPHFAETFIEPAVSARGNTIEQLHARSSVEDIQAALAAGDYDKAIELRHQIQRRNGRAHTGVAILKAAGYKESSKKEFYAWRRGEKRVGSAPDKNFRRVLIDGF